MIKNIIREVSDPDFSFYFDGDMFNENAGDFGYTIFPLFYEGRGYSFNYYSGINDNVFKDLTRDLENIIADVELITSGWNKDDTIKDIMRSYGLKYSPKGAHTLKVMIERDDFIANFCDFLTIKTGKKWDSYGVHGYCQGDYVDVVYCDQFYTEKTVKVLGEMALGCGKEFCVIDLDDDGNEVDSCYGYYVTDSEAWRDEDIKSLVCDYAGIDPDTTQLELFDGYSRIATYRTA